jgi:hypothetical protein
MGEEITGAMLVEWEDDALGLRREPRNTAEEQANAQAIRVLRLIDALRFARQENAEQVKQIADANECIRHIGFVSPAPHEARDRYERKYGRIEDR